MTKRPWAIFRVVAIPTLLIGMGIATAYLFGGTLFSPQSIAEVYEPNRAIAVIELVISLFAIFLGGHFYFTELPKLRK